MDECPDCGSPLKDEHSILCPKHPYFDDSFAAHCEGYI